MSTRVVDAQVQARKSLGLSLAFVIGAGFLALTYQDGPWLPLHLLFAGGLLLAISGASQLFAAAWSAAPAPSGRVAWIQRWTLTCGVVMGATGHEVEELKALLYAGAALVAGAAALLAWVLVLTASRGRLRRFDPAIRFYATGLALGVAGIGIAPLAPSADGRIRTAHALLNLLGLVGLVIAGTLPFFVATEARVKISPRATPTRQAILLVVMAASVSACVVSILMGWQLPAALGLFVYGAGILGELLILPRVRQKQLKWAGPRLLQLGAGILWWSGSVLFAGTVVLGGGEPFGGRSVIVLAVGGFLQILLGSLAYLGPVLRGGGHVRLAEGFSITRSWESLVAVNLATLALLANHWTVAGIAIGIALGATAWRSYRLLKPTELEGVGDG
ncbi:MAG: hypothetical protein DCC49_04935 [Acidobacteria bacterium]|nr:MAG: hypothetical protein DCC49_04935 [Acidobacteriota bacterium]